MKRCNKCGEEKPKFEFYIDRITLDGLNNRCITCKKEYNQKNKQLTRDRYLEREYGMLPGQYEMMLKSQNGVCKICYKICSTGKKLCVDHCKETNKVRGLLCKSCNIGIGELKHNPELLKEAIKYLKENS